MSLPTVGRSSIVCVTSFNHVDVSADGTMRMTFTADRGQKFALFMLGAVKKDLDVTERHLQAVMCSFGYLVPKDVTRWSKRITYLQDKLRDAGVEFVSEEDWLTEGDRLIAEERENGP